MTAAKDKTQIPIVEDSLDFASGKTHPSYEGKQGSLEGQILGNYQVISLLGKGGMGEVYLARHPMLGREVAVKVLTAEADPKGVARFQREAKAVCRIGHPNIVEVFDFGVLPDGREYAVMERLVGETLGERLAHQGRLDSQETLEILAPLMEALHEAHNKGIVHRDIKPDNIFLAQDRGKLVPKLLDFGIAKLVTGPGEAPINSTATGMILGTPLYMSPEQAAGNIKKIQRASDIYSFGAVLYHMLTGRTPFSGESYGELLVHHMNTPPPKLSSSRKGLPKALDGLIQKAMAKDPVNRFTDMLAMRKALYSALGLPVSRSRSVGDPLSTASVMPSSVLKDGLGLSKLPSKWLWIGGGACLLVALLVGVFLVFMAHGEELGKTEAKSIEAPNRKNKKLSKATSHKENKPRTRAPADSPQKPVARKNEGPKTKARKEVSAPDAMLPPDTIPPPGKRSAVYHRVMNRIKRYDNNTSWSPLLTPSVTGHPQTRQARKINIDIARRYLKNAESFLKEKKYEFAYKWALMSYRNHPSGHAAQIVGVASCHLKNEKMARQAIHRTSKTRAETIRKACKKNGLLLDKFS